MQPRPFLTGLASAALLTGSLGAVATAPASAAAPVHIAEIHYDNDGADAGEGVEVAGPAGTDLTGWTLVPYNGNGGSSYSVTELSGTIDDEGEGAGAVWFPITGLQNGGPDGVALVHGSDVVEFLSYEGSFAAADGPASGTTSSDIGVAESSGTAEGDSLQLLDGAWTGPTTGSPGTLNSAAPEPPDPTEPVTIAQIQGTGEDSPLDGSTVTTRGVVTAVFDDPYPDVLGNRGGYDGYYLQTAGTGGTTDATPGASDAVFVYDRRRVADGIAIGDEVELTAEVSEFRGITELSPGADDVTILAAGTLDPVTPLAIAYPATDAAREAQEGMLLAPTGAFTVTNTYITNQYAEIGLAAGTTPLIQPTDVARPGTPAYDDVVADNAARGVLMDDGANVDFLDYGDVEQDIPLPWLAPDNAVRVGASVTFTDGVILEERHGAWRFQPRSPVTDTGQDVALFEDTRAANLAPQPVGGDVVLGTFNVLNYFNTTGAEFEANGGECSFYTDRDGEPVATNRCHNPDGSGGPRGAADAEDLARQQEKIVAAINAMGADVVALEELENSIKLVGETDRDDAIAALVAALNDDAGAGTWDYVASPDEALDPANHDEQDVIRTGFIYRRGVVKPVGSSDILFDEPAFANGREPLAQVFMPRSNPADKFAVIANHFKSKGCSNASGDNADAGDGQGCYNADRVAQAEALVAFADEFGARKSVDEVFLTGDFNAYTQEDPMQVLYAAGYAVVDSDQAGDWSYSFSGLSGSLDHVLASPAAMASVTGADVWEINANEAIAFQYSRYNYNATDFHQPGPFAASDHNPEVVGIDVATRGRGRR